MAVCPPTRSKPASSSRIASQTRTALQALLADLPGLRRRIADVAQRTRTHSSAFEPVAIELRLPDVFQDNELTLGRASDCNFVVDD